MHYSACMDRCMNFRTKVGLFLLWVCVCVLLFADLGKSPSLLVDSLFDFGHVPLFMVVAAVVLRVLDTRERQKADLRVYAEAFAISLGFGAASEIVQHFLPDRSFELGDIGRDAAGALAFVLVAYQHRRPMPHARRVAMTGLAVLAVLAALVPVAAAAADELRARRDFPLLASFETTYEMKRWVVKEGSASRARTHATDGLYALELRLEPGVYPGATLDFPPRDWRGFESLAFDAYLEGTTPLPVTVRINDLEHNEQYADRYNKTFTLKPGANRVVIDLHEVERSPVGRRMDMGRIALVCLFSYQLKEPRTVYLDNVRLGNVKAPGRLP